MTEWAELDESIAEAELTADEQLLGAQIYEAIQWWSNDSERSRQASAFKVGISDLGTCQERTRRMIAEEKEPDRDALAAFLGTAIGDHVEKAIANLYDNAILHASVSVELTGDAGRSYVLTGHPDIVFPWGVADVKTVDGLENVKRTGPSRQQLFQRTLYTLGAFNGGLLDGRPLGACKHANVWIDRSGRTKNVWVNMQEFDARIVDEATMWLDEVVYAHLHNEPARKEPPREWCYKACGFAEDCRGFDIQNEGGLLLDPEVLAGVDMYQQGLALEKRAKQLKDEGKAALTGVSGSTGEYMLSWTHVNPSEVAYTRKGYDKLNIRKVARG